MKVAGVVIGAAFLLVGYLGCQTYPDSRSPEESIASFRIIDGFNVELYAAEPDVVDPVAMTFDANGRAYVAEMLDYPFRPDSGQQRSRIRLLEDTDGDGQVDRSSVFADSLMEVTSILPWKGGVLATAAPDILYLKDTDQDRRADLRQVLFTGFYTGNSEAQITNLRFGIDNWIYASNNGRDGKVVYTEDPQALPLSVKGSDFRFRLDQERFEAVAGAAQYGQDFDDWGHRFISHNTLHIRHVVDPINYFERNPNLPDVSPRENINDHGQTAYQLTPAPYWRAERTNRRNKRYQDEGLDRTEHAKDHFTGASGVTIYSADLFPEKFRGNAFTGDVAGNFVHRDILQPQGATFVAKRGKAEQNKEFLASTDPWFRPTNLTVGPNGCLYVVDMYRQHIESPYSIPEDLKKDMDFYNGDTKGRIYRISPQETAPPGKPPALKSAKTAALVKALSHPNRWWRLTAQRLLIERQDLTVLSELRKMVRTDELPQARLHALYALEGLSTLDAATVKRALSDPHPGVREHAVRLAEEFSVLLPDVVQMTADSSKRVAFQVGLSLGTYSNDRAVRGLADLAARHGNDPWVQTAILSSSSGVSVELLEHLAAKRQFFADTGKHQAVFLKRLAQVVGARGKVQQIDHLLEVLSNRQTLSAHQWQTAVLTGLASGLKAGGDSLLVLQTGQKILKQLQKSSSAPVRDAAQKVATHVTV